MRERGGEREREVGSLFDVEDQRKRVGSLIVHKGVRNGRQKAW